MKLWWLLGLFLGSTAFAADYKIQQGSTLSLIFPVDQVQNIEGSLEGQSLKFSVIEKAAHVDEFITRGEFMDMLEPFILSVRSGSGDQNYPDVSPRYRYYEAIKKATDQGIVQGYADGRFGPDDTLTRAQAAKIIMNVFPPLNLEARPAYFPDIGAKHTLKLFVDLAVENGIFKGYPDGNFRPNKPLSIREAQIIIERGNGGEIEWAPITKMYWRTLAGISRLKPPRTVPLSLKFNDLDQSLSVEILPRVFAQKSFNLPTSQDEIRSKEVQDNSWDMINSAREYSDSKQLWVGRFLVPAMGVKTLGFGDNLTINGQPVGSHFGHDIANDIGTPIWAANNGKVVLSDFTPSFGNTVIIDHGQNVFTMYLHNSELKVSEGDTVKKGDVIALMGSTGISTGSHLHYSHWVGDTIVDGEEWFLKSY